MTESGLRQAFRSGGLAAWSIHHPIGITMITLALVILGLYALQHLPVNLLPQIIYPEIRVRIIDPGVPASIMEDRVTRQLEEQLAITEGAVSVHSESAEGSSLVGLDFPYGTDIDTALRDASNRLDRAKRFLPDSIDPPSIWKRDPAQIAVAEYVISSDTLSPVALRSWVDYRFSKWFLNLPGVASTEVGGGLIREIKILPDLEKLAAVGLTLEDMTEQIQRANRDMPGGRLATAGHEYSSRTQGRLNSLQVLQQLPLRLNDGTILTLGEVAAVADGHQDEKLRVRFNGEPGIKMSIQKQPAANAVEVVDAVERRIAWLHEQNLIPAHIRIGKVSDQAVYVRHALNNAALAGLSGALLAMLVVYLFLGDLRRTLIIGSAMPIAIAVTFIAMPAAGLTLNIMTLGGLAIGIGMLVDSTIVMLENMQRHQRQGEDPVTAGTQAAREVNSAIVASTATNLAAVLPFLLIGGLTGLLFRELIFTVSAAILAAMMVALTLVPAWAARLQNRPTGWLRRHIDHWLATAQRAYQHLLERLLEKTAWQLLLIGVFVATLLWSLPAYLDQRQIFLPSFDEGVIYVSISADPGQKLDSMDTLVKPIETLIRQDAAVKQVMTITGGFIFGRTERELPSRASLLVELLPNAAGDLDSQAWIGRITPRIQALQLPGVRVYLRVRGVRGLRVSASDDAITLRIQGPDLDTLNRLGQVLSERLRAVNGLRNVEFPGEERHQELSIDIDRQRAADLGLSVEDIGQHVETALNGRVISDFLEADQQIDIRLVLPENAIKNITELGNLPLLTNRDTSTPVRLSDVARIRLESVPSEILRDQQQRMTEVTASLSSARTLGEVHKDIESLLADFSLPSGYRVYDVGEYQTLRQGRQQAGMLIGLAVFLVFVVMAVQYESLRNPFIILLGIPFAAIGPAAGLNLLGIPVSMPVWLGLIMLAGIVVNNAIVMVEYIEILRTTGRPLIAAVSEAGAVRLRPILMTTLTTVVGLLPLASGLGRGSEMLQPLAQTIVFGLSFSLLVSLLLIPVFYVRLHPKRGDTDG